MNKELLQRDGWIELKNPLVENGFDNVVGPYWFLKESNSVQMGLFIEERHTNGHLGTVHGGVLCSFADVGLGAGLATAVGELATQMATISLDLKFLAVARVGEFISVEPEITRQSRDLVFVRGLIKSNEKTIASAEGVWKLLNSAGKTSKKQ